MTPLGFLVVLVTGGLLFALPRRWVPLPFLLGAVYMPGGQEVQIGPFHFTALRILVVVAFLRIWLKGEHLAGGLQRVDKLLVAWAVWLLGSSVFHESSVLITRLGIVFSDLGSYFLFRTCLQETDDVVNLCKLICLLLLPLAAVLMVERLTGKNYFALLGGTVEYVAFRHGHFRARGPFGHSILAGTVGATCLPMALYLWRQKRQVAVTGATACLALIVASGSSGPVMTLAAVLAGLACWRVRRHLGKIRWLALLLIAALDLVMKDPVYYLIGRIDISGGSTGWYRARLIQSALEHLSDWWLAGTDMTRGWTHVSVGSQHSDITNHYIILGIWGGLPLLAIFVAILTVGFNAVGRLLRANEGAPVEQQVFFWTLGAILFGHAVTFVSISYFDQSAVFFYLLLASIVSLEAVGLAAVPAGAAVWAQSPDEVSPAIPKVASPVGQ
jgi:hypothetical protein